MTAKVRAVLEAQADVLVVDTAHGHQEKMIAALELARGERDRFAERTGRRAPIVAGNVVTADGVRDLAGAGADIIKVGYCLLRNFFRTYHRLYLLSSRIVLLNRSLPIRC